MLTDTFVEQSVKIKKVGARYYLRLVACVLLSISGLPLFLVVGGMALLFVFGGIYLFVYFSGDKNKEYEYCMTNGNIDIAAIYNGSRRKELYEFDLSNATMVVPYGSNRISNETFVKTYDYTSRSDENEGKVSIVVEEDGKKKCVHLEPNEKGLEHIKQFARHKCYDL